MKSLNFKLGHGWSSTAILTRSLEKTATQQPASCNFATLWNKLLQTNDMNTQDAVVELEKPRVVSKKRRGMSLADRKERQRIEHIIRKTVPKPLKNEFATPPEYKAAVASWWEIGLLEVQSKEILASPTATISLKYRARKDLERVEERKKRQGIAVPHLTQSHEAVVSGPLTKEDVKKNQFLAWLTESPSSDLQDIEPDLPQVDSAKPIKVTSKAPELYCENCRVPMSVCRCSDKETCPSCLIPKGICICRRFRS
jgi:hypothetical protein